MKKRVMRRKARIVVKADITSAMGRLSKLTLAKALRVCEGELISLAMKRFDDDTIQASKALGITRDKLWRRLRACNLRPAKPSIDRVEAAKIKQELVTLVRRHPGFRVGDLAHDLAQPKWRVMGFLKILRVNKAVRAERVSPRVTRYYPPDIVNGSTQQVRERTVTAEAAVEGGTSG